MSSLEKVEIFDVLGKRVYAGRDNQGIDVGLLKVGVYTLVVHLKSGLLVSEVFWKEKNFVFTSSFICLRMSHIALHELRLKIGTKIFS